jgi:hypothetical protein
MQFPSKKQVARQRRLYPAGTRVELVQMDDAQARPLQLAHVALSSVSTIPAVSWWIGITDLDST